MSSFLALRALLFAGEMLFASALIMVLAWLASWGRPASRRHLAWLAAFAALLVLPFLASVSPSFVRLAIAAPAVPVATIAEANLTVLPPADPGPDFFSLTDVARAAFAVWLAGIFLIALRGLMAAFALRALRRQSVAHDFGELPEFERAALLRVSSADESGGPVTWGFLRPVVLLPKSALFWSRERLDVVLRHEMAHVRRRDSFAQMLSVVVCALYWPNPLVWLGARALRRDAEIAADDAVIVSGVRPSTYAGELLQLASEFRARRISPAMTLYMAAPSALEARVQSVLASAQQRSGVTKMDVLKIACAGILATSALVMARPSLAQDTPQTPATPAEIAAPASPTVASAPLPPPPAPHMAPAPAAPPLPPAPPSPANSADASTPSTDAIQTDIPADADVRVREELRTLNGEQQRRIEMIVTKARLKAREAIEQARPEIEKAIAEARISETAAQAVKDAQPQFDEAMQKVGPEVDRALAEARAELAKANLDVKVRERVDAALKRAQLRIQAREADRADSERKVRSEDSDSQDDR